jgi:hypothetical protein
MEGFPDDIHTHVEADASLDDEFPPLPGATGGTLDDALPYAATVAATLDPMSEDDVEPVPVRDEAARDATREGIRAASMREEPAVDLGTGELLAFADASSAELLDSGELDADEVLDDLDDLEDADLLDDDDLVEDAPRAKASLPPPPPRRND